jgi:hypothetical protein
VSGGGGWGLKQGLLSLDPQTTLASDEHQDMQSFIDSFKKEASPEQEETFVQFFVEAMSPPTAEEQQTAAPSRHWKRPAIMIGTPGSAVGPSPVHVVEACRGLFGAVSSEGVYLEKDVERDGRPAMASKLDAPGSYVVSTASSWTDGDA